MKEKEKLDYSRVKAFTAKVQEFVDTLPDNLTEENGFTILVLASDLKNKVSAKYSFLNKEDERQSLVDLLDTCLSGALKGQEKKPLEWELFNGIGEYIIRLCAAYPELYKGFQDGIEKYKKHLEDEDKRSNSEIKSD